MERIKLNIQRFAEANRVEVDLVVMAKEAQSALNAAKKSVNDLSKALEGTTKETKNTKSVAKELKTAFSEINISYLTNQIKKLGKSLYKDFLTKAIDTSEELNLFNVVFNNISENGKKTFSDLGKQATSFQKRLNEAFGTNMKETMRYQGLFQAMGESAGLEDTVAALMSENMTKLAYDLASLYNTTETKAAESLRAGVYAGQTKPLRNYGIDVTQTSYKPLMEELGLEKSVSELTQAEKEILRYISTLKQAKNAMGDFANTIESPANQLKILRQQFYEMQAAIGNLFVGAFARLLPYANAIIMTIKAVAQAIAGFFNIELSDYNSGLAYYEEGLEDYSDALDGVGSSAGGASKAIDKLKRQTLAFDQINNLTSPTDNSSSGGGGGGGSGLIGGIDERLLEAIKGYDNGMDKVRMKANEIRDKMMEILGFTRDINGEWEWGGFSQMIKNFKNWFDDLDFKGKTLAVVGMITAFTALLNVLKGFGKLTGLTSFFKTIGKVGGKIAGASAGGAAASGGAAAASGGTAAGGAAAAGTAVSAGEIAAIAVAVAAAVAEIWGLTKAFDHFNTKVKDFIHGEEWNWSWEDSNWAAFAAFMSVTNWPLFSTVVAVDGIIAGFQESLVPMTFDDILDLSGASKETKDTLGKVMGDYEQFTKDLNQIKFLSAKQFNEDGGVIGSIITQENVDELKRLFGEATNITVTSLQQQKEEALSQVDGMKDQLGESYQGIRDKIAKSYDDQIKDAQDKNTQVTNIVDTALKERGYLTEDEMNELNKIIQEASGTSVKLLSDSQAEAAAIFQTMKEKRKNITAQEASDLLSKSAEVRDKTISDAETQYDEICKQAEKMRAAGLINDTEYQAMRDAAKKTRDETVEAAKKQHEDIYNEFASQNEDIVKYIDQDTGKLKSTWKVLTEDLSNWWNRLWGKTEDNFKNDTLPKKNKEGEQAVDAVKDGINKKNKPKIDIITSDKGEVQVQVNNATAGVTGSVKVNADTTSFKKTIETTISGIKYKVKTNDNGWVTVTKAATGGIYMNGGWQPIQAYANGGVPSGGQLFMAREAGPELVGRIGRHTAVMNNNQIVDSVKAGVYEAVSAAMGNANMGGIEIVAHTDEGVVIDRINRITRQTGECPIDI